MQSLRTRCAHRRFSKFLVVLAMLLVSHWALADAVGSAAGVVRDASGALVAGARITLTRLSTNAVINRTSDASGSFQFLELAPDTYTLTVEAPGFKRATLSQIVVQVDQAAKLDVMLQTGDVSEVVNVEAGAPLIDTEQNTLSNVVDTHTIASMPLNSRGWWGAATIGTCSRSLRGHYPTGSKGQRRGRH